MNERGNYPDDEIVRILDALIEDAAQLHREALLLSGSPVGGHTAVEEDADGYQDADCLTCGHINEAEYLEAVLLA